MTLNEITNLPPDTSATAAEHTTGFRAGWRAAMELVRRHQMDPEYEEYPAWFVTAMDQMADRIMRDTADGPAQETTETGRCGGIIADAIRDVVRP